jgi:glucose-fructose oxidoreductase
MEFLQRATNKSLTSFSKYLLMSSRRKFIAQSLGGLGALALTTSAFSSIHVPKNKAKLGVALVGLGYYSTDLLAPALQLTQHCSLVGIVTGTPSKAETWKAKYGLKDKNIYNYETFDSIANNDDIDVVYVVLPPSMHAEYSIRAAKAGKHVWCEKPMAMSVRECQQMIDAAKANKVKLSIGYRLQHEPNTKTIMQFAKDHPYGKIKTISAEAGYFDSRTDHWKQKKNMGGGVMYDMGVYPLNAARYSAGLEPIAVSAKASTTRPEIYKEVEEIMEFNLKFPGGTTAACLASFGQNLNALKVNCEKGWYELVPFQSYNGVSGKTSDNKILNATIPNEQAQQMDDDALAIMNNKNVLVPGEEGLRDIRVVEAVYKSVAQNSKEVSIS